MPQAPYAKLRASINGGAVQIGGITVPASATVQLSPDPSASVGANQYKYEIYGYPIGFAQPSGWSTDSKGVYFYSSSSPTPPVFTLSTIANWGKFMLRLTLNNAISVNPVVIPVAQLIDESTALSMLSPTGLADVGLYEANQFGTTWVPAVQASLRAVDSAVTAVSSANAKQPAKLVSIGNIASLSGEQTIDSVLTSASRVLLTGQTTASQNGLWVTGSGVWTRPTDFNTDAQVIVGQTVFVTSGTTYSSTNWQMTVGSTIAGSKTYAQIAATSKGILAAANVVSTANVSSLSGEQTIDSVTTSSSRVLLTAQTTTSQNGVWLTGAGAWSRPSDFNADAQVIVGQTIYIISGTINANTNWQLSAGSTIAGAKTYNKIQTLSVSGVGPVDVVSTSNITTSGLSPIDGVTPVSGSTRILLVAQTTTSQNGVWVANPGPWTRPVDFNADAQVIVGQTVYVKPGGTLGGDTAWYLQSGTTIAGAKVYARQASTLLQDALSNVLPAQGKTQHKGAAILQDPSNGRNTIDHDRVDIREYGGNPNGVQQTTHTSIGGNASVSLGAALTYAVGQWLMLHQAGAAHSLATPGTPIVVMQGTAGTRTVSVKWVAATDHHGYTAASAATTIANATIDAESLWHVQSAGATFTRPGINGTFVVQVTDSSIFTVGRPVTIVGDFYQCYQCTAIPDGTHVTLKYLGGGVGGPVSFAAGTQINTYQYAEAWCPDVPYADKYLCYVQFDGSGSYNYYGQIIAHPLPVTLGAGSYYHPASIRITTSTPPTPPPGIPATAPSAAVPNALRTQITGLSGTTATVSPAPTTSATGQVCEICNRIPFEDSAASDLVHSAEIRMAKGDYYCAGNVNLTHPPHVVGANAGLQAVASRFLFRDGAGISLFNTKCARAWQPGVRYRVGERVTTDSVINVTGTWALTTAGNGQTWALSTTTPPAWTNTLGSTTTDANGNVWTYDALGLTAQGAKFTHIGFASAGMTAPAQRSVQVADLRNDTSTGPLACNPFLAGTTYGTGAWVVPPQAKATGKIYQCLTGGVAGAGPALWGRVVGDTTSDGTLTWMCFDLQWLQGALIAQYTPADFDRCQAKNAWGAGVAIEAAAGPTGGNANDCKHSDWDFRGLTGSNLYARGSDANLITIERGNYNAMVDNQGALASPYQADNLFAIQDASFYGLKVLDPGSQGGIGFQNLRSNSVQAQARLASPYIEHPGQGVSLVDYNSPAIVGPGGNYGKVRDGATAKRKSGPYQGQVSTTASTPDLVLDDAGTMQEDYESAGKTWVRYNGDVSQPVQSRLMAQLNFGAYSASTGKQLLYQLANPSAPVLWIDHYGGHGRGLVMPAGLSSAIEGLSLDTLNQAQLRFVNAVPTVGTFRLGDRLIWCADNRRLAIIPTVTGGLAPTAWASSHAYVNGDIVGQSSKTFVMVSAFGTSAGSLSGSFASAAIGDYIVEGGCCWYCWSGTNPALRAIPNWGADPAALPDSSAAVDISGGPVRTCSAFTGNRAPALALTNAMAGDGMRFENPSAFTCSLPADGGTIVLPAKSWVELVMNAGVTAWHQTRYGIYL